MPLRRWGDEHDVAVVVDHIQLPGLAARAATEVATQRGHDIFAFPSSPAAFEDDVIDHRALVEEAQGSAGPLLALAERSAFNPRTKKWFGFPELAETYRRAMTPEVLSWDAASNNRFLVTGRGSAISNPISALRTLEKQDPAAAEAAPIFERWRKRGRI